MEPGKIVILVWSEHVPHVLNIRSLINVIGACPPSLNIRDQGLVTYVLIVNS